jgi:protocatechuate 3,4-dioxygenase alpha subunit
MSDHGNRRDNQDPQLFGQTPWQTVGPFFHYGLPWKGGADLVGASELGARAELFPAEHYLLHRTAERRPVTGRVIELHGRVIDGKGQPLPDAMIEIWQADAAGSYASEGGFVGFGRSSTSKDGEYRFRTVFPGRVPGPGGRLQAPHIAVGVFGRGLLKRLVTRAYFAGEASNDEDAILACVPAERRATLVAARAGEAAYRLDVVLQGGSAPETVFFEL